VPIDENDLLCMDLSELKRVLGKQQRNKKPVNRMDFVCRRLKEGKGGKNQTTSGHSDESTSSHFNRYVNMCASRAKLMATFYKGHS
jgi:hypothetical protein